MRLGREISTELLVARGLLPTGFGIDVRVFRPFAGFWRAPHQYRTFYNIMGRLLAGVSFLGTPSTGHPDVADGSTTALTNGDGFRPVAGPAARTRRSEARGPCEREFYRVTTPQGTSAT